MLNCLWVFGCGLPCGVVLLSGASRHCVVRLGWCSWFWRFWFAVCLGCWVSVLGICGVCCAGFPGFGFCGFVGLILRAYGW